MLNRRSDSHDVVYFASPLLERAGVPHAFSTRLGGVSTGPLASLNLGNPGGSCLRDSEANLHENYRRLFAAAGLTGRQLCRVHQVHAAQVCLVSDPLSHDPAAQADSLLTANPAAAISIRTADCAPLLLSTSDGRWVAAVHSGWRGVIAEVLPATIRRLLAVSGGAAADLLLAVGPCISDEFFEVGPEVTAEFRRVFGQQAPIARTVGQKSYIDLTAGLLLQAQREGLPLQNIDFGDHCTFREPELFFSHRRDHGLTGRMAAVIAPRVGYTPPPPGYTPPAP